MNLWKRLFGAKEAPQPAPLTRYKVTLNFVDRTNGRKTAVTVPNATHMQCYNEETVNVFSHQVWVERDMQVYIESETQTLVSVSTEVVRG